MGASYSPSPLAPLLTLLPVHLRMVASMAEPVSAECAHDKRRTLYRLGPKADGSPFLPDAARCSKCGALLERDA